jgi:hypothetical protein
LQTAAALRGYICASDQHGAVVFKATSANQLGRGFLDTLAMGLEDGQRVVVKAAEVIGERFHRDAAVDAFFIDDRAEPDNLASVMVVPFVGEKFDIRFIIHGVPSPLAG